jgi:hypothetical protein
VATPFPRQPFAPAALLRTAPGSGSNLVYTERYRSNGKSIPKDIDLRGAPSGSTGLPNAGERLMIEQHQKSIHALARPLRLDLAPSRWSRQGRAPHPSRVSEIAQRKGTSVRCSGGRRYPGHFFAPSPLRLLGAGGACDGVGQANGKSLLLSPAPTIETKGLFLDVFHKNRAGAWREFRRSQHAFNDRC